MNFAPRAQKFAVDAPVFAVAVEPAFDFASAEYRTLHANSCATVFQSPIWLAILHQDLCPAFRVGQVIVTVRNQSGRLMVVLPLTLRCEHGLRILEFSDFGLCDYHAAIYDLDELALLDLDATLPQRIAAHLPHHDILVLDKLIGNDPLLDRLFPGARRALMRQSAYPAPLGLDPKVWRDSTLSEGFRRELDTKRRKFERLGTTFVQLHDADAIAHAFGALRRYRSERFKTIGAPDVMDNQAIFAFYRRIAIEGMPEGLTRTEVLYLSGEPVSVQFGLTHRGTYSMLLIAADLVRHRRLSPGLLLVDASIHAAIEAGDRVYDFTIGDHPYKQQFGATAIPLYEWHRPRTLRGYVAFAIIALVREAKRVLKPWLKRQGSAIARSAKPINAG
jgi:CelD/BcsL family acetyltransferase involved in cellulose biosynthesis